MDANPIVLKTRREPGWNAGLANMLGKELGTWWRTRRWWIQGLVALVVLNLTLGLNMGDGMAASGAEYTYLMIAALCVPVAAVNVAQDSILGERHAGTAAWVLSKPLKRTAFIVAKLIAHGWGLLLVWVALPGTVAYFQLTRAVGAPWPGSDFAAAMGLVFLNLLFYFNLAMLLATLFDSRGAVLGISLAVLWAGPMQFINEPIQKYAPWLGTILPWNLLMSFGKDPPLVMFVASGKPLPSVTPIIATLLWCVVFVAVAIWRFSREEF